MYGNLSSEQFQKEVSENQLVSSITPGIYKNAKLVSLIYVDDKVSKAVFTFQLEDDSKGTVDLLEKEKDAEKITRAFLHIIDAFKGDTNALNSTISSFAELVSKVNSAINKENLVDFKIKGYTYTNQSGKLTYSQGFPLSGQNSNGGWIPNSFMYPAGITTLKFSDYELKGNAEYDKLKNGKSDESELDKAKEMEDLNNIFKQPEITI